MNTNSVTLYLIVVAANKPTANTFEKPDIEVLGGSGEEQSLKEWRGRGGTVPCLVYQAPRC
jgi:hypothetical protein